MKLINSNICLILVALLSSCASMQTIPDSAKTIEIVSEAPARTKSQIYIASKSWIAETFRSAKAVIEVDSKDDGLIMGNGSISYPCSGFACVGREGSRVPFTIRIDMKDDKFKTTFTNISIYTPGQIGVYPAATNPVRYQADLDIIKPALLKLVSDLGAAVNSESSKKDW